MKTVLLISITILHIHLFFLSDSSQIKKFTSIQDLLKSKGLPGGLFPRTVKSYNVDQNGQLEVSFDQPCLATFEGEIRFDRVVKGNLSYGGLVGVEGMSQRELFLWFSVRDIIVNDPSSGIILFNIGVAEKQLPVSLFEDPPTCQPQNEGYLRMLDVGFEDQR
ncbi:hypothetical protein V2J09_002775 [Rumex salicifolius]